MNEFVSPMRLKNPERKVKRAKRALRCVAAILNRPEARIAELRGALREFGMMELPISMDHAVSAGSLESTHRDPFDRLLIAQSRAERMAVVTHDPVFAQHGVEVIW